VAPPASFADATEARLAPLALLSIADRDKGELPRLARALERAGFRLAATDGTRAALAAAGFEAEPVAKLASLDAEGRTVPGSLPDLVTVIRLGDVRLVVNTPTPRSGPIRDAAEIRHAAIEEGVPCLTAIETAIAAAEALDPDVVDRIADVRSITDWLALIPARAGAAAPRATAPGIAPIELAGAAPAR
jgi:carbamoyl-phosphate synthase large subunit